LLKENAEAHLFYSLTFEKLIQILIRNNRQEDPHAYLEHLKQISGNTKIVQAYERMLSKISSNCGSAVLIGIVTSKVSLAIHVSGHLFLAIGQSHLLSTQ